MFARLRARFINYIYDHYVTCEDGEALAIYTFTPVKYTGNISGIIVKVNASTIEASLKSGQLGELVYRESILPEVSAQIQVTLAASKLIQMAANYTDIDELQILFSMMPKNKEQESNLVDAVLGL